LGGKSNFMLELVLEALGRVKFNELSEDLRTKVKHEMEFWFDHAKGTSALAGLIFGLSRNPGIQRRHFRLNGATLEEHFKLLGIDSNAINKQLDHIRHNFSGFEYKKWDVGNRMGVTIDSWDRMHSIERILEKRSFYWEQLDAKRKD